MHAWFQSIDHQLQCPGAGGVAVGGEELACGVPATRYLQSITFNLRDVISTCNSHVELAAAPDHDAAGLAYTAKRFERLYVQVPERLLIKQKGIDFKVRACSNVGFQSDLES